MTGCSPAADVEQDEEFVIIFHGTGQFVLAEHFTIEEELKAIPHVAVLVIYPFPDIRELRFQIMKAFQRGMFINFEDLLPIRCLTE